MIESDRVDAAALDAGQTLLNGVCALDRVALSRQFELNQTDERVVIVDVKNDRLESAHVHWASGTCMTAKNNPSCFIALAKPS